MSFLLFAGMDYYPRGGWQDFIASYDKQEDARRRVTAEIDDDSYGWDWAHIVKDGFFIASYDREEAKPRDGWSVDKPDWWDR